MAEAHVITADHDTHVAHHFENAEQQYESSTLGMWIFLVTEVMFFGGLFGAYGVYRANFPGEFIAGSKMMDIRLGAFNTVMLIASSLTMALAVRSGQLGRRSAIVRWLIATMFFGSIFLGVKAIEYHHKWEEHLVPGPSFHFNLEEARELGAHDPQFPQSVGPQVQILFSLYFAMTGMHAVHMIIGIGILLWLTRQAAKGTYSSSYYTPVEVCGLYWHFVDIVWIFLFPLLYLIG